MKIKVYVGWINGEWYFVDAPNKRIAKWCVANLHNNQYMAFKSAKDVEKIERFKMQEETKC